MREKEGPPRRRKAKRSPNDPTLVRNQPALTTAKGNEWLIVGGLFLLISGGVLLLLHDRGPAGLAVIATVIITAFYLGMIAVRFAVHPGKRRLAMLAILLGLIALVALVSVLVIAGAEGG